jgi:hypothetical protein
VREIEDVVGSGCGAVAVARVGVINHTAHGARLRTTVTTTDYVLRPRRKPGPFLFLDFSEQVLFALSWYGPTLDIAQVPFDELTALHAHSV